MTEHDTQEKDQILEIISTQLQDLETWSVYNDDQFINIIIQLQNIIEGMKGEHRDN